MDLSLGVYWDIPVLLGSFRLSSHKKVRRSYDCSVNKKTRTKKTTFNNMIIKLFPNAIPHLHNLILFGFFFLIYVFTGNDVLVT